MECNLELIISEKYNSRKCSSSSWQPEQVFINSFLLCLCRIKPRSLKPQPFRRRNLSESKTIAERCPLDIPEVINDEKAIFVLNSGLFEIFINGTILSAFIFE